MTVHHKYERHTWRPQWYFAFNVCCVNSYLIWKDEIPDQENRKHRQFREELSSILLNWPYEKDRPRQPIATLVSIPNWEADRHVWEKYSKRGYCC